MVKALPETTAQNGPPSRKAKVNVVADSLAPPVICSANQAHVFADRTAEAVTT